MMGKFFKFSVVVVFFSCTSIVEPTFVVSLDEVYLNNAVMGKNNIIQFMVYNQGNATLKIEGIESGCKCTTPKVEHLQIEPGDSTKVEVIYRPSLSGPDMQTVTLWSNSKGSPHLITIKAMVQDL